MADPTITTSAARTTDPMMAGLLGAPAPVVAAPEEGDAVTPEGVPVVPEAVPVVPEIAAPVAPTVIEISPAELCKDLPAGSDCVVKVTPGQSMTILGSELPPAPVVAAAPSLGDAYVRGRGLNGHGANHVFKMGLGGTVDSYAPETFKFTSSYETVIPFNDPTKANGGSHGLVAKADLGVPLYAVDGSTATTNYEVGYRLFGPEIWIGGATATSYVDSPDDGEKGAWKTDETAITYHVRGAMRFFADDYKNDTDLPLFLASAQLSGPEFGLGTFDALSTGVNYNPAIYSGKATWHAYEPRPYAYTYANDLDKDGVTTQAELDQLSFEDRTAQREKLLADPVFKAQVEAFDAEELRKRDAAKTSGKVEDHYLLTSLGFNSTRLDEEGFTTGLSLDRDTQQAEGMAFDNSISAGATAYIGIGDRAVNGQHPYMLSLSASYAHGWDSNGAADPAYNAEVTQYYTQQELTPETGDWALEARINIKDKVDFVDSTGAKVKAPMTPHQMIVNDPVASVAVSLSSSATSYGYGPDWLNDVGAVQDPTKYIGGDMLHRDLVETDSLILGVTGTYSKYTRSIPLFGGTVQFKPSAGVNYNLSEGVEDGDRFGFNLGVSLGYKKKGQL